MSKFGYTGTMCLKKEVCKAHTFVLGPSQEYFFDTDAEFKDWSILDLIKSDHNNRFIFSLPVFVKPVF